MLKSLRKQAGTAFPVPQVRSGYRDPNKNAAVGGANDSEHTRGNAVDIDVTGWTEDQKKSFLRQAIAAGARGVGVYPSGNSIHLDVRETPMIWGMSQRGPYRRMELHEAPPWAREDLGKLLGSASDPTMWQPRFKAGSVQDQITQAAAKAGLPPSFALAIAGQESSFDPNKVNSQTDARGLFQFIPSTRQGFGVPDNAPVEVQVEKGVAFVKRMYDRAKDALGREPTAGEVYVLHYQGEGAGAAILKNPAASFRQTLNAARPDFVKDGMGWGDFVVSKNPWLREVQTNQQFLSLASTKMGTQLRNLGGPQASTPIGGTGRSSISYDRMDAPQPISQAAEAEARRRSEAQLQRWDWWQTTKEAATRESALSWISTEDSKFIYDPDFKLTKDRLKEATKGLDERYWGYFERARSGEHLAFLREQVDKEVNYERQLAAKGVGGMALRMSAAILDPAGWALVAATGPLIGGAAKGDRLRRMGILAAEGAAANIALSYPQFLNRPGQELDDLIMAGAMGAAFGSAFGAIGKPRIDPDLARQTDSATKAMMRDYDSSVSPGAMGAASADLREPLRMDTADVLSSQLDQEIRRPGMGFMRKILSAVGMEDFASALSRSDNELVAAAGNRLVQDAVGSADKEMTTFFSVSEKQRKLYLNADTLFMNTYRDAYTGWAKEREVGMLGHGRAQTEFNELVTAAVRSTNPLEQIDPHVSKAAETFREMTERYARLAADPGLLDGNPGLYKAVRGFEDGAIPPSRTYAPRFVHWAKLQEALETHGDKALRVAVRQSIQAANKEIEKELADKLAGTWLKKHREVQAGMNSNFTEALSGRNTQAFREALLDEGYDLGTIERLLNVLKPGKDSDAGAHARAKHRLLMDENFVAQLPNGQLRISDLFDNDIVRLSRMYNRQMSAQVSMATFRIENPLWAKTMGAEGEAVERFLIDGISSRGDWDNFLQKVRGVYDEKKVKGTTRDYELKNLQRVYELITGTPHALEAGNLGFFIRTLQKFNFARVMNQVGFAQIGEFGNILGQAGTKATMEAMPMYKRLSLDASTGQMSPVLAREIVYMTSAGTDWVRSFANGVDEFGSQHTITGYSKTAQRVDETLDSAGRVTSAISLMAPINYQLQRIAAGAAVARFANMAGEKATMSAQRLRHLGLSDDMTKRVLAEIKEKAGRVSLGEDISGANINALNLDKWEPQARAAFENSIWRWSRTMIQENDVGQMSLVTSNPIGKLFFQFRSFMLAAYTKQTLHSIHMRDWPAFTSFMFSMVFGGLAFSAQTYLQSIGRSDQQQFLTEKLGDDDKGSMEKKLALAAFQRTGASSLFPMMADQMTWMAGFDPLFAARSTSLPSQGLVSNPTLSLVDNILMSTRSLTNGEYSQTDARRQASLSLFQNFLPFQWTLNSFISDLPEPARR
jgi:hypothetical protein